MRRLGCSPCWLWISFALAWNPEWKPMYNPTAEQAEKDRAAAYESGVPHGFVTPGDKYAGLGTIALTVISDLVRGWERSAGRCCEQGCWKRCCCRPLPAHPPPRSPHPPLQHTPEEYGTEVDGEGRHRGGPFAIQVSPKMRIEELRCVIRVSAGLGQRGGGRRGEEGMALVGGGLSRPVSCRIPPGGKGLVPVGIGVRPSQFPTPRPPCQTPGNQDKGGVIPALQKLSYGGKNLDDAQRTLEQ